MISEAYDINHDTFIISHRGNLDGPNPDKENHPDYLIDAFCAAFDTEVDLWLIDGKYILGHDKPQYEVEKDFLVKPTFWIHCKNIEALYALNSDIEFKNNFVNYFFHDQDAATLTSDGFLWTFPNSNNPITPHSIAVMPEGAPDWEILDAAGTCTDFPKEYRKKFRYSGTRVLKY